MIIFGWGRQTIKQNKFTVLAGIMLLLAIPSIWPYSYYQLLRWMVTIVACYSAYLAHESKQNNWTITMGIIAVLFNPIAPIHLDKSTWGFLDLIASGVMFYSVDKIRK